MYFENEFGVSFFVILRGVDEATVVSVQAKGCSLCFGRLDRADYPRKPRGGLYAQAGEGETVRYSLCCRSEGCRRRVTPPSVRFLGRRVYLSVVVVLAAIHAVQQAEAEAAALKAATGVPAKTLGRWVTWWQSVFAVSAFYSVAKGELASPVADAELPAGLLERFSAPTLSEKLVLLLRWLSPVTTLSCPDGARFMRAV